MNTTILEKDEIETLHSEIMTVTEARLIAVDVHGNQRDRDGSYHIQHVARVAEHCKSTDPYQRVAWLHDALEDAEELDEVDLSTLPEDEREALEYLTRDSTETYKEYISRIAAAEGRAGAYARAVKRADLMDNLRRCLAHNDRAMIRYAEALNIINRKEAII